MPAISIPDPLPPAVTLPREVIEFAISEHLREFGDDSLVAHLALDPSRRRPGPYQSHGLVAVRR
jgi:hypothetical protein